MATARKPVVDASPLSWAADGRALELYEESQEPFNAGALKRRREKAEAAREGGNPPSGGDPPGPPAKFSKLDLYALVLAEDLRTPAAVMRHVQDKGSLEMQSFLARSQPRLPEILEEAKAWGAARADAAAEEETDWAVVERVANERCPCAGPCPWKRAAASFFRRNTATLDSERLAACLAKVIQQGPGKNARVPLMVGPTNTAKTTVFAPIDDVFGEDKVMSTPALGASMPLVRLTKGKVRFLFWDEYNPVAFASLPPSRPTIPALTFLKLFAGQRFEAQVSQCFHNGNKDGGEDEAAPPWAIKRM